MVEAVRIPSRSEYEGVWVYALAYNGPDGAWKRKTIRGELAPGIHEVYLDCPRCYGSEPSEFKGWKVGNELTFTISGKTADGKPRETLYCSDCNHRESNWKKFPPVEIQGWDPAELIVRASILNAVAWTCRRYRPLTAADVGRAVGALTSHALDPIIADMTRRQSLVFLTWNGRYAPNEGMVRGGDVSTIFSVIARSVRSWASAETRLR